MTASFPGPRPCLQLEPHCPLPPCAGCFTPLPRSDPLPPWARPGTPSGNPGVVPLPPSMARVCTLPPSPRPRLGRRFSLPWSRLGPPAPRLFPSPPPQPRPRHSLLQWELWFVSPSLHGPECGPLLLRGGPRLGLPPSSREPVSLTSLHSQRSLRQPHTVVPGPAPAGGPCFLPPDPSQVPPRLYLGPAFLASCERRGNAPVALGVVRCWAS